MRCIHYNYYHSIFQFAIVTPYFEKSLMSGSVISHALWIAGPVSGLNFAPIVGGLSDRCTSRYGRRRPYIVGGVIFTVFSMLTFSNAKWIISLFIQSSTKAHQMLSIIIETLSFCILDFAINTTMWPSKFNCSFIAIINDFKHRDILALDSMTFHQ